MEVLSMKKLFKYLHIRKLEKQHNKLRCEANPDLSYKELKKRNMGWRKLRGHDISVFDSYTEWLNYKINSLRQKLETV